METQTKSLCVDIGDYIKFRRHLYSILFFTDLKQRMIYTKILQSYKPHSQVFNEERFYMRSIEWLSYFLALTVISTFTDDIRFVCLNIRISIKCILQIISRYLSDCINKDRLLVIALEHLIHLMLFGDDICLEIIHVNVYLYLHNCFIIPLHIHLRFFHFVYFWNESLRCGFF